MDFNNSLSFLGLKTVFLSFSTQNHAESSGYYLKKSILDPKRAKLNRNIFFNALLQKKERCKSKEYFRWFAVSACPPEQVLASPDISKVRVLVQFRTFRVQNLLFGEIPT